MAQRIVIAGFGAAGAASAAALCLGGVAPQDLLVVDSSPRDRMAGANAEDARFVALNAGSRRFLAALGVWRALDAISHPLRAMAISDSATAELVRAPLLDFAPAPAGEPLAHLVPLAALTAALRQRCTSLGVEVVAGALSGCEVTGGEAEVSVAGTRYPARLVIGADGAGSPLRRLAGIGAHGWGYGQSAIVTTVHHTLDHQGQAVQHFLPSGPFAMLPLDPFRSSLVWSERTTSAAAILAADQETQRREIERRAAGWRGEITAVEALTAHPLRLMLARRFAGPRVALVADAAHVVHPLAGQGLNLGFEDVALLAELVVDRLRLGLDPGAPDLLAAYQARRRPAAAAMALATDGLNRLFSNDLEPLRLVRDLGAGLIARMPEVRTRLARAASGITPGAPRLFRGEAL